MLESRPSPRLTHGPILYIYVPLVLKSRVFKAVRFVVYALAWRPDTREAYTTSLMRAYCDVCAHRARLYFCGTAKLAHAPRPKTPP